ncbi:hypothetical protein L2E82_08504 [Cichorium intybus]|uniref:Uncharacterized protein n=1 Tax=Cichorium intybus TaxID=13427 RepID=A0ACB9G8H0_CICIN|nr:hypothetical protein L2E82_08504 [Cichorium intybus]
MLLLFFTLRITPLALIQKNPLHISQSLSPRSILLSGLISSFDESSAKETHVAITSPKSPNPQQKPPTNTEIESEDSSSQTSSSSSEDSSSQTPSSSSEDDPNNSDNTEIGKVYIRFSSESPQHEPGHDIMEIDNPSLKQENTHVRFLSPMATTSTEIAGPDIASQLKTINTSLHTLV